MMLKTVLQSEFLFGATWKKGNEDDACQRTQSALQAGSFAVLFCTRLFVSQVIEFRDEKRREQINAENEEEEIDLREKNLN